MLLKSTLVGLIGASAVLAVPVQDGPRQRLLDGKPLRIGSKSRVPVKPYSGPYTPGNKDPLDKAIDAIGDGLDPLPWRNGLGASVLGPWNKDRSRSNPDLVRPPSTDHGNLANMRWSFADSHVRIEVSCCGSKSHWSLPRSPRAPETNMDVCAVHIGRRLDSPDNGPRAWHEHRIGEC